MEVSEAGDSTIRVAYKLAQAGFYRLELIADGVHLADSPYSLQVSRPSNIRKLMKYVLHE